MTPKDMLTNPAFCPMPWTGIMYNFDGTVKNCIRSAETIGNIQHNTIEEIVQGSVNTVRQDEILHKKTPSNCVPCADLEVGKRGFDIVSDRVFYIRELKSIPTDTYRINNFDLQTVDVRWTNLCNFACVYCGPEFSSRWAAELKVTPSVPSPQQLEQFQQYIYQYAHKLRHVYLAGGEPLLMKENLQLLKRLNPNVNLRINTNLSKTDTQVFDMVCSFKNVHWTVSVESQAEEFEYIRHGGLWSDFLDNLNTIRQFDHKISFNMLHLILNYDSVFDCVDYLQNIGFHNNSFVIGPLLAPLYLNIRHLPEHVLQLLRTKLESRINAQPGYLLEESYRNMLTYLQQPFEKNLAESFKQLAALDSRRAVDSSTVFKDLYKLKEEHNDKSI